MPKPTPETELNPSFFDKEALYKTIVEEQTELISIAYPNGLLTFVNAAYAQHFGLTPEAMVGTSLFDYVAVEARAAVRAHLQAVCECGGVSSSENQMLAADGTARWVVWTNRAITDGKGHVTYLQSIGRDLTARRQAEQALAAQYELIRVTLQSIADGVIATDADGVVQWFNPVAERMTGWVSEQARGKPLEQVFHLSTSGRGNNADKLVADCIVRGSVTTLGEDTVLVARDGTEYGIEESVAPILDAQGRVHGTVLVFRDVSTQRRLSHEMTHRAKHDALTGLLNRAEFESRIGQLLTQSRQAHSVHALLFIDLDRFKQVNDACGHAAGDLLLQQMAKMLQDAVRSRDTVARLGGDEFAILLENCAGDRAREVGQQICDRMDKFRFVHNGQSFRLGTSIGLVQIDEHWSDIAAIVHAADTGCYAAKAGGRNRVHTWVDSHQAVQQRQGADQWGLRLEEALQQDLFVLYAQQISPVQTVAEDEGADGTVYEVLLRMVDTDGQLILPGAFLSAAERLHLGSRLDLWVLTQAVAWLRTHALTLNHHTLLSVNLTAQAVGDRAFWWELQALVQQPGWDARQLCLEIPEAVLISQLAETTLFITEARALGVRIAIDDFGGTYTSFSCLKNLTVDFLKVDGHYQHELGSDALKKIAVRGFCEVAQVLGAQTVLKSAEHPTEHAFLALLGLYFVQGCCIHEPQLLAGLLKGREPA